MPSMCWEVNLEAQWDSKTRQMTLKCPRSTKPPPRAVDCEQHRDMQEVNIDQLLAELRASAEEESS